MDTDQGRDRRAGDGSGAGASRDDGPHRYNVYRSERAQLRGGWLAFPAVLLAAVALVGSVGVAAFGWPGRDGEPAAGPVTETTNRTVSDGAVPDPTTTSAPRIEPEPPVDEGPVGPPSAFSPINTSFAGLVMFRGNSHRAYYGTGPAPIAPRVLWRFPEGGPMSASSSEGGVSRVWAGTGWTGQPVVAERNGRTEVMFGAYDRSVHFLDADTGARVLPDLPTGDLIKGSVSLDPDGYPLLYTGSRDNFFRVVALDRAEPAVLWKLNAASVPKPVWNNDWDSSAVVVGDYLFEGGENSYFFIIKLNRNFDAEGKVAVAPEVVLAFPGYNDALFKAIGDRIVSIESSPAVDLDPERGDRVYFSNSGGRIVGLDIGVLGLSEAGYGPAGQAPGTWERGVAEPGAAEDPGSGAPGISAGAGGVRPVPDLPTLPADPQFPVVFDFWTGDDVDASIVIDDDGMLYVAAELERMRARAKEVGQLMKLDPYREGDPLVWSVADPSREKGGIWATPALSGDMIYVPTHTGRLLGVDKNDGRIVWEKPFTYHAWSSPAVVDSTLIVGDTNGWIHAYDIRDPTIDPPESWKVQVPGGGAVESTPAVWRGRIYVGSRNGYFYCFGD